MNNNDGLNSISCESVQNHLDAYTISHEVTMVLIRLAWSFYNEVKAAN